MVNANHLQGETILLNASIFLNDFIITSSKWNCETCIKDVVAVAEAYSSQEGTSHIITALDGTAFCESDWIGLDDEDQVRTCKHLIRVFMPLALDSMTDGLNATAKEACNSWFQDVCKK